MDVTKAYFVERLLKLTAKYDIITELHWTDTDKGLEFWILCNDFFIWASADGENVETEEDLILLEQSLKASENDGALLYCARKRKVRPQGAYYTYLKKEDWHLFDACGEKREVGMGNPYAPGEYKKDQYSNSS